MSAFRGEVHPLADVFPMLDGDSLQALADDIAVNGLRERIVIDKQGRLVDGRNRLAACRLAGVTPAYVSWPVLGTEEGVAAWIASANLQRRDLTQGQKAHLAVRLCSKSEQTARDVSRIAGVPLGRIGEAQTIAQFCPDLPAQVIAGTLPHVEAYRRAMAAKAAHTSPAGGGEHLDHEHPGPRGQQQTPAKRRKPLTDQARTASYDLLKAAERLQRLTSDDRWTRNAEQVREAISSDLSRAIEALTTALQQLQPGSSLP